MVGKQNGSMLLGSDMTHPQVKLSDEIDPHNLKSTRLKALWILDFYHGNPMTSSSIARELVSIGISTSRQAVEGALTKKNGSIHKDKKGYIIMEKGREELKSGSSDNGDNVIYIESNKPFSAKSISIRTLFKELSGEVRICDPYVDPRTLDIIFQNLDKKLPIKILTQTIADKPSGIITRIIKDLTREGFSLELRVNTAGILHDRYLLDRSKLWYSGNSLNGLGNKESLLISLGKDIYQNMSASFDSHWKKASVIK